MSPRRIPTKGELLRLQRLYRNDRKIAEFLGGDVTEHLVAYWRRKKGIPLYSLPKFSEKEILEVWDRFGDDFHAGMELGISKAAFYNWRRRYKITRKPAALKLEQLSLELFTNNRSSPKRAGAGRQTIIQKIFAQRLGRKEVASGERYDIEPDIAMVDRRADVVLRLFHEYGITYVWNPSRIILSLDGAAGDDRAGGAEALKAIRHFARLQQIRNCLEIGEGDGLQVALEQGLVLPGQLIAGTGAQITILGCIGAPALVVGAKEMAGLWAQGKLSCEVPETIRINVSGRLPRGVLVRDVAHQIVVHLLGIGSDRRMIEFNGPAVDQMSIADRFTLCCLVASAGVSGAVTPFDATTRRYVNPRARRPFTPLSSDRDAVYAADLTLDVNTMTPILAGPNNACTVIPVEELAGVPVQQIFLGGAANGRFDDLKIAADVLKGKHTSADTRLFIQPASRMVLLEALKKGLIRVFVEAGAIVLNPGRSLEGRTAHILAAGEKGLTTAADFPCDGEGDIYQVSSATAAASALSGQVTNPAGRVRI